MERVRELEGNEARVKELEADALLRTMDYPEEEASFCGSSDQGTYEPNFDRDWVSLHPHRLQCVMCHVVHALCQQRSHI